MKFQMFRDRRGEWRWNYVASNGKVIADSAEGYANRSDCEHAINLLKIGAATAPVYVV